MLTRAKSLGIIKDIFLTNVNQMVAPARSLLICFTGIDGSGKTTLAKNLVCTLDSEGFKFRYVYNRVDPIFCRLLRVIGDKLFFKKQKSEDHAKYSKYKNQILTGTLSSASKLFQTCLLFEYCIQAFIKVKLPYIVGANIVLDRYVYDTIITDLAIDFDIPTGRIQMMLQSFFKFYPKPNLVFLVDADEKLAYHRKNDVPSIGYLAKRRMLYLKIVNGPNIRILNGANSLECLYATISNESISLISNNHTLLAT